MTINPLLLSVLCMKRVTRSSRAVAAVLCKWVSPSQKYLFIFPSWLPFAIVDSGEILSTGHDLKRKTSHEENFRLLLLPQELLLYLIGSNCHDKSLPTTKSDACCVDPFLRLHFEFISNVAAA